MNGWTDWTYNLEEEEFAAEPVAVDPARVPVDAGGTRPVRRDWDPPPWKFREPEEKYEYQNPHRIMSVVTPPASVSGRISWPLR